MVKKTTIVDFLFEAQIMAKIPRSGFFHLGHLRQSVAEHNNGVMFCAYVLSTMFAEVDREKILTMALFHDIAETRTSDFNRVHHQYVQSDEKKVMDDMLAQCDFAADIKGLLAEYKERKTLEAQIVKDADILELLLMLKQESDMGNKKADERVDSVRARLYTEPGKKLAEKIAQTPFDNRWFHTKDAAYRKKKKK